MKIRIKQTFRSLWAVVLTVLMIVSTFTVAAVSLNNENSGAKVNLQSSGYSISSNVTIYFLDTASWGSCNMYIWKSDGNSQDNQFQTVSNTGGKIFCHKFTNGWSNYAGFKFNLSSKNWDKETDGNIEKDVTANTYFLGASATPHTTMSNVNGAAQVVNRIAEDGSTYNIAANANCTTTVKGYTLSSGSTSATSTSKSTSSSSSSASINAAYGSTITYSGTAGTGYQFMGFSTTNSSSLPSDASTGSYTRDATGNDGSSNTTVYAYYKKIATTKEDACKGATVKANKDSYSVGDTVEFTATATNPQSGGLQYKFTYNTPTQNGLTKTYASSSGSATLSITNAVAGTYKVTNIEVSHATSLYNTVSFPVSATATVTDDSGGGSGDATDCKFLYKTDNNDPSKMKALDGVVYEGPKDTYTLTITDSAIISELGNAGNVYFALSSSSNYTGMYTHDVAPTVDTKTSTYLNNKYAQECNGYHFAGVHFTNFDSVKRVELVYVYSATNPTYYANAYTDGGSTTYKMTAKVAAECASMGSATVTPATVQSGGTATFKATANAGYQFEGWYNGSSRVSGNATYTVTPKSDLSLTAKFKAISSGNVYVMTSTTSSVSSTSKLSQLLKLEKQSDGSYLATTSLSATTYYIVMKDQDNEYAGTETSSAPFSFTGTATSLDHANAFYNYKDGYTASKLTITKAGQYTFKWTPNSVSTSSTRGNLLVSALSNPFVTSGSTTFTGGTTTKTVDVGDSVVITTSVVTKTGFTGQKKFSLVNADTSKVISSVTSAQNNVSFTVKPTAAGTTKYNVVVTTSVTDSSGNAYTGFTTNDVTLTAKAPSIYYADTSSGDPGAATNTNYSTSTGEGTISLSSVTPTSSYTFSLYTSSTTKDVDHSLNFDIDTSAIVHATIEKSTLEDGTVSYTVSPNTSCSGLKVMFNANTGKIWVTANYNETRTNVTSSSEKVRYYFAEHAQEVDNSLTGAGVRIRYWNNSLGSYDSNYTTTTVTNKATLDSGTSNAIYVKVSQLYGCSGFWDDSFQQFNIYYVDLPVWATSFCYMVKDTTDDVCWVDSPIENNGDNDNYLAKPSASIALNHNRVNLFFNYGKTGINDNYYSRSVPLDKQLWSSTGRTDNSVGTKTFKAKAVKYNLQYESSGSVMSNLNDNLESLYNSYSSSYKHPLYFGYFDQGSTASSTGLSNFKIVDNLAMRNSDQSDDKYYYASVQGLVGDTLDTTKTDANGFYSLRGCDNKKLHPLFDYSTLKVSKAASKVYQNLDFPFSATTYNGITTYSYDSFSDYNREISSSGNFTVSKEFVKAPLGGTHTLGFFPFVSGVAGANTNNSNYYGFSTEFDIGFYMSNTGYLLDSKNRKEDISFNFSGDDDVWVFVDGIKVLDLGGDHKPSAASINFTDMKVYYKSASKSADTITSIHDTFATSSSYVSVVDLQKLFEAFGNNFDNNDATTKHTLQMFYMERGAGESNCSMSFNLPQNSGLRVNNVIDTSSVNAALVNDTRTVANKDYFQYKIQDRAATTTESSAISREYPNAPTPITYTAARSYNATTTPNYPNIGKLVYRDYLGTRYNLNATSGSSSASSNTWINSITTALNNVYNVNYTLSDSYAETASGAENEDIAGLSGRTSGTGNFNLLFGQAATFDQKIPNNTLVGISQSQNLYNVSSSSNGVITEGTQYEKSTRAPSKFYTTSYEIFDDNSGETVNKASDLCDYDGDIVASDNISGVSGNNVFYYANYDDKTSSSNAMTVTFTNKVATSKIYISKNMSGDQTSSDNFYFTLNLWNIFGNGSQETDKKTYSNLVYSVYDLGDTSTPIATRTYGKAGIYFKAGQYAVIDGVPIGTEYEVNEKVRAGYNCVQSVKTVLDNNNEEVVSPQQKKYASESDFKITGQLTSKDEVKTYYTKDYIEYINEKVPFTVTFNYYDHKVVNGMPADINSDPTSFTVMLPEGVGSYAEVDPSTGNQTGVDFEQVLVDTFYGGLGVADHNTRVKPSNVIDDYEFFSSQSSAVTQVLGFVDYQNSDKTKTYSQSGYNESDVAKHFDCYGRTSTNSKYSADDSENWVTYYSNGESVDEAAAKTTKANDITSISVWLFNRPKEYNVSFVTPNNNAVSPILGHDGYYVGSNEGQTQKAFYNMRFGQDNTEWKNNVVGSYLSNYGITKGCTGSYPSTPETATYSGKSLDFLYWSYDSNGYEVASNDIQYGYRITSNEKLYAIYGDKDGSSVKTAPGVSLSDLVPDNYIDEAGIQRTRLNTLMNVYNCDSNDKNIKQAAVVYVRNNTDTAFSDSDLKTISVEIKKKVAEKSTGDAVTFVVNVNESDHTASGFVYDIVSYGSAASAYQAVLTNKNRLQFSNDFKTDTLIKGKVFYTFAGINYEGTGADGKEYNEWIMADNTIKYSISGTLGDTEITGESVVLK